MKQSAKEEEMKVQNMEDPGAQLTSLVAPKWYNISSFFNCAPVTKSKVLTSY